ncbi:alcohol dehydrogenase catalytic domain-containing protein [Pseudonocardia lutea]|uniref:alcohol dehydrogenase n=1 Tax=Pseudonocardia lutea TaxID=2172015 RepID=A0ABW1IC32_9PSEU
MHSVPLEGTVEESCRLPDLGFGGPGEVAALDAGASGIAVGDRVVVDPMRTCEECEDCRLGRDSACARLRFVGEHFDGTFAEYIAVPVHGLVPAPAELDDRQLAAALAVGHDRHRRSQLEAMREATTVSSVGGRPPGRWRASTPSSPTRRGRRRPTRRARRSG